MNGIEENYQALANAIALQAVQDYQTVYKTSLKKPDDLFIKGKLEELRRFFDSQWFVDLTGADGANVVRRIEKNPNMFIMKRHMKLDR